jgi:hypothetical protein
MGVKAGAGLEMVLTDRALLVLLEELGERLDRSVSVPREQSVDGKTHLALKFPSIEPQGEELTSLDGDAIIDFRNRTTPVSVAELAGFSFVEPFGRWTDSDIARITFRKPLAANISMFLTMMCTGHLVGQPLLVVIGGDAQVLRPVSTNMHRYRLQFDCRVCGQMIEFFLPHALSPHHLTGGAADDKRRLAIGIQSIVLRRPSLEKLSLVSFFSRSWQRATGRGT